MNSWYHTIQNFGRRKSWQIWQITKYSPEFSCLNFSFQKQQQLLGVQLACYVNSVSKLNSMLSFYKSTANFIDQIAASQLASQCNTRKIAQLPQSHNVSASRQPTSSSIGWSYKTLPLVVPQLVSYIVVAHGQILYFHAEAFLLAV